MRNALLIAFAASSLFAWCSAAAGQNYQAYEIEYRRIQQQIAWCQAQYNRITPQQRANAAMRGYIIPLPACNNNYPYWISRGAFLETQLNLRRNGITPDQVTLCEYNPLPGCRRR
jgi:hypothetical protein